MLIKEYRIPLPLTLEEYKIAQLYMIQKKSREESEGHESGVEIIENRPYTDGPFGSGQYTYKVYYIGRHIPSWLRSLAPKSALEVHEESWNAYPRTRTKFSVPFVEKFMLEVDTVFQPDGGTQDNVFNLSKAEQHNRELDIVNDTLTGSDYKEEEDPSIYQSLKTGRGPLESDWIQNPPNGVIMCSYKLIKVEFRYWGLQSRIEQFIHDYALRRVMLRAHRQAWAWQDEWVGLTMEDIRRLELETKLILQRKFGRPIEEGEEEIDEEMGMATINKDVEMSSEASSLSGDRQSKRSSTMLSRQLTQSSYRGDLEGLIDGNMKGRIDSEGSYCPLDNIAIHEDSDTEYFDAKEAISDEELEEYNDPLDDLMFETIPIELMNDSFMSSTPIEDEQTLPTTAHDILVLVVYGGWGNQLEPSHHDDEIDRMTLKRIFNEVYMTHYNNGITEVYVRFVPCPDVTTSHYNLLSSLQCRSSSLPTATTVLDHAFPLPVLPLLATEDSSYRSHLNELVALCNTAYRQFLYSDEGLDFNGQVCVVGDCMGSILMYDILTSEDQPLERGYPFSPVANEFTTSSDVNTDRSSQDVSLLFPVSGFFMFGSSLALVLSLRHIRNGQPVHLSSDVPLYNLFYASDPLGFRLEPLLDPIFSSIEPSIIPSYMRYPTGNQLSTKTFSQHSDSWLLDSIQQSHKIAAGTISLWGNQRIDYLLEAPSSVEQFKSLPVTVHAHVIQARYWEAKELVSFVLRQLLQSAGGGGASIMTIPSGGHTSWVSFIPPSSVVKWNKRKTSLRIQKMSPNHRAVDVVSLIHSAKPPTLQAKFFYGPLNMATLTEEMIDIYMLHDKNVEEGKKQPFSNRTWNYIATTATDKNGRVIYDLPMEQCPQKPGLYPLVFLVKGDHTIAGGNLFVLPPHTEAVVFSIDGALCSNFSLSGRDMKIKEGAVQVTRLWQKLGYLIIYITGRPILQKEYINSWLAFHKFPLGVVSFSDTLSTDNHSIKLLYLARLMKEAKVILCTAYCSQRHLSVYKELGLQPDQIYVHAKSSSKKNSNTSKTKAECQLIMEGFPTHLMSLKPRPAAIDVREAIGEMDFGYTEIDDSYSSSPAVVRHRHKLSSSHSPKISKSSPTN